MWRCLLSESCVLEVETAFSLMLLWLETGVLDVEQDVGYSISLDSFLFFKKKISTSRESPEKGSN